MRLMAFCKVKDGLLENALWQLSGWNELRFAVTINEMPCRIIHQDKRQGIFR